MVYLDKMTSTSLDNYFDKLSKTGYYNDVGTKQLLLLTFLTNMLKEYHVSEREYNKISSIVNCIVKNNCMVPYHYYQSLSQEMDNYMYHWEHRYTEDMTHRNTTEEAPRTVNL